jgi:PKD repeat protein
LALAAVLLAVATFSACDKVPLLAPTESTITLNVSTTTVQVNGSATLMASVVEAAGTPVHNGTVVTFTASFGTVEPPEAATNGGVATARFVAGTQSGTAVIGAFSGGARAETVEVRVGGAAAGAVVLRAEPRGVGVADLVATVVDESGNLLTGVPVSFSTSAGQVSPITSITDANGEARSTISTSREATVTARAGAQTATVTITPSGNSVTITPPTNGVEAGVAAAFRIAPATGVTLTNVIINWGDSSAPTVLGTLTAETQVVHTYSRAGIYTIRATTTDAQGITADTTFIVNVTEQSTIPVTLTATPNPVSVSSPAQQGLVSFQAQAGALGGSSATISTYSWDFGDGGGTQTTGAATNHRYIAPGNYQATVTVRSTTGQQGFASIAIRVNP